MKKTKLAKHLILIILFLFSASIFSNSVSAFFFDKKKNETTFATGSIDFIIENAAINTPHINRSILHDTIPGNAARTFLFTARNNGLSDINYSIDMEIVWLADLPESGKLFIFSSHLSDETIFNNIQNNDFSAALVAKDASDSREIITSEGKRLGIRETIDSGILAGQRSNKLLNSSASYSLKLFFFEDEEVKNNAAAFNNQSIEINIIGHADISLQPTGWQTMARLSFHMMSSLNLKAPIIWEIEKPRNFFITQSKNINLQDYAVAYDDVFGDISDRIVITSLPTFNPNKAGVYDITYNVENGNGIAATPLHLQIVIWDFIKIASGTYHSLALTSHGKVYAWGRNTEGQLGDGSSTNRSIPLLVADLNNIIDIAACNSTSYALASDGQLYSWGHNGYGHLGDGTTTLRRRPGKVVQPDEVLFTKVFAHFNTVGAISTTGEAFTWGYGQNGATGNGSTNDINPLPQKINLSNVDQLTFGQRSGAALTTDGKLYTWGDNSYGTLGNGTSGSYITTPQSVPYFNNILVTNIVMGSTHGAAIDNDGRIYTWGSGFSYNLGNNSTSLKNTPQLLQLEIKAVSVDAGIDHNLFISDTGSVYAFGANTYGKLGFGNITNLTTPTIVEQLENVTSISAGQDNSFVLISGSIFYGTGIGKYGALGNGAMDDASTFTSWLFTPPEPFNI